MVIFITLLPCLDQPKATADQPRRNKVKADKGAVKHAGEHGQIATFDVTAFVKSAQGPYFGFILVADGGDVFCSTSYNYGTPPELFVIGAPLPPPLTAAGAGNQIIISWSINNSAGLTLQSSAALGASASWNAVSPAPALEGNHWMVTQSISGANQFFRLSSQ